MTLGSRFALGDIPAGTATHDNIRTVVIFQIFRSQVILVGPAARMADHGSRCGVRRFGLGNDTYGHAAGPFDDFTDVFYAGIVKGIFCRIFIYAHGVDNRFMTCRIGRCRVGAVCRQGIIAAGRNQTVVGHLFHSQQVVIFPIGHAFGDNTCHFAGLKGHAVADEEDDVFRLFLGFFLNDCIAGIAYIAARIIRCRSLHRVAAGFGEIHVVHAVGNDPVVQIRRLQIFSEEFICRLIVDGDVHVFQVFRLTDFYIKIKLRPCQKLCVIYGQNAYVCRLHTGNDPESRTADHHRKNCTF